MKKKISFKIWLAVLFGGVWQFIRNIFSWKNKTPFWRIIWCIFTVCLVIITSAGVYEIIRDYRYTSRIVINKPISSKMNFTRKEYSDDPGWISNKATGEIITADVDWIYISEDEDSLIVFSSKGKRGYLNRYSGEVAITPQFDKAWMFSSGLGAVVKNGKLFFIDHSGKRINNKNYVYNPRHSYAYHGDYCIMNDEHDMLGLIDRDGNWKIKPEYECIFPAPRNYWKMRKGNHETGLWYAFNDKAEPIYKTGTSKLDISEDLGIIYTLPNHMKIVIDFNGNKKEFFLCQDVESLYYDTEQRDSTDSFIQARCTLYRYRMDDGYEGLMRENGDIVTEPLYWSIRPVGKDLYHCTYKNSQNGVIINSDGVITNEI